LPAERETKMYCQSCSVPWT